MTPRELELFEALENLTKRAEQCARDGTDVRRSLAFTAAVEHVERSKRHYRHLARELGRRFGA